MRSATPAVQMRNRSRPRTVHAARYSRAKFHLIIDRTRTYARDVARRRVFESRMHCRRDRRSPHDITPNALSGCGRIDRRILLLLLLLLYANIAFRARLNAEHGRTADARRSRPLFHLPAETKKTASPFMRMVFIFSSSNIFIVVNVAAIFTIFLFSLRFRRQMRKLLYRRRPSYCIVFFFFILFTSAIYFQT